MAGLVYSAAFASDRGEPVASLIKDPPPGESVPPILPPEDGFLLLDKAKFADFSAADVDPGAVDFMADSQVPWSVEALHWAVREAAWKAKQSRYPVAIDDRMISARAAGHGEACPGDSRGGARQSRGVVRRRMRWPP